MEEHLHEFHLIDEKAKCVLILKQNKLFRYSRTLQIGHIFVSDD